MTDGGWLATHEDITELRRNEAKIAHMALHDGLTDLPNRTLSTSGWSMRWRASGAARWSPIHLLDLDLFKNVNDTLGHAVGDKLLKAVADRLRALVRGGGHRRAHGRRRVRNRASRPGAAGGRRHAGRADHRGDRQALRHRRPSGLVGTSVGIAVGPTTARIRTRLTRNADLALYRAKSDGRGTFRFFEPGMDVQMQARRALEHDLRKALAAGEFELHYQPVLNLARNEITGVEALVRWRHPGGGMISPGEFIPLAEEIGLIVPLGEWAIRQACTTAAAWPTT